MSREEFIRPDDPRVSPFVHWIVDLTEGRWVVPGTDVRFGLDPLIGLIPGLGDVVGMVLGAVLLIEAWRHGASWWVYGAMLTNLLLDAVIGVVPVAGDAFDFYFKANRRNLALLEKHLRGADAEA